jgi:small redox-active disulfide protein 2
MQRSIKILGPGCAKCVRTSENVHQAVERMQIDAVIEKVEDPTAIMQYDIMRTPAVVVDGTVHALGRIPTVEEVVEMLNA